MTVIGVGVDVVEVRGFAEQLGVAGSRFGVEAFAAGERAELRRAADLAGPGPVDGLGDPRSAAARFAAKEAFVKAWSASRFGLPPSLPTWSLHEVEIRTDVHGRPSVRVTGDVADALRGQWGDEWRAHVSLTHDGPVAAAFVVLEVEPFESGAFGGPPIEGMA